MPTSYKQRKTPGVYVTELDAFPPSIVGVQTAIPGFVGYTEKAEIGGQPMYFKPIAINSMAEFEAVFGGGFQRTFQIAPVTQEEVEADPLAYDFAVPPVLPARVPDYYALNGVETQFNLYGSMQLFFDNGGGSCYVVSVGDYTDQGASPKGVDVEEVKLVNGLTAMGEQTGPTMLVVPDAVLLPADPAEGEESEVPKSTQFGNIAKLMLTECGRLQDRVAILDVYGTAAISEKPSGRIDRLNFDRNLRELITNFQEAVGSEHLNYGMAYFPDVNSTVTNPADIKYTSVDIYENAEQLALLQGILEKVANETYGPVAELNTQRQQVQEYIDALGTTDPMDTQAVETLDNNLSNALPILQEIENIIGAKVNMLPPSGAMSGVFTRTDQTRGVWNAPANTSLSSVVSPSLHLNDEQQGNLNVPINGKAVDVLREFIGRGTVVWGARTLDGNSNDWRYIQVRRTLIYIEQSIKQALDPFIFAANDGNTWVSVTSMVSGFLQSLWSQGGLMGATANDAYTVECGLGSTMTAQDILEGYMIVQVTLQMIRPAEFIELTFKQKMEGA